MNTLLSSLNSQKSTGDAGHGPAAAIALNAEGKAPDWIMLVPSGRLVVGRDGRQFTVYDPEAIIAATARYLPLPMDYLHDYENRKPGDDTPAAGWIEAMEVREGAIWGNVKWTKKASAAIEDREYRFVSPAFLHTKDADARIMRLTSAGLVHRPNFVMPALNNQQDPVMDKDLLKALGLAETADTATAIAAVNALQTPSPAKYVPRADYDQMLTRATNAEQKLAEDDKVRAQAAAEQLVDKGIADGKVAPASRDHYLKLALNSRADVEALLASAPAILKTGADDKLGKDDPAKGASGLTATQKAMCDQMGLTEEQFLKAVG